ncbi:MAG: hypothetical protein J6S67_11680, partial [Methanobrevibacter sp.]|nr:hypothetical protein [Methanobrevibacter sp.]
MKNYYATEYKAGDAFLAGHLGEWVAGNKEHLTKNQLVHLINDLDRYWKEVASNTEDPDKMTRHLNLIFEET